MTKNITGIGITITNNTILSYSLRYGAMEVFGLFNDKKLFFKTA